MSLPCVRCAQWLRRSVPGLSTAVAPLHPRTSSTANTFSPQSVHNSTTLLSSARLQHPTVLNGRPGLLAPAKMDYVQSAYRWYSDVTQTEDEPPKGLFKKFKWYWKKYWYVLVPVHLVTSAFWFGSFYYLAYSGMDIISLLQTLYLPDSAVSAIQKIPPAAGHAATAYVLYKVFTPLRYTLTIGGTVVTIRALRQWGVLPTAQEVRADAKEFVRDKREDIHGFVKEKREKLQDRTEGVQRRWEAKKNTR